MDEVRHDDSCERSDVGSQLVPFRLYWKWPLCLCLLREMKPVTPWRCARTVSIVLFVYCRLSSPARLSPIWQKCNLECLSQIMSIFFFSRKKPKAFFFSEMKCNYLQNNGKSIRLSIWSTVTPSVSLGLRHRGAVLAWCWTEAILDHHTVGQRSEWLWPFDLWVIHLSWILLLWPTGWLLLCSLSHWLTWTGG